MNAYPLYQDLQQKAEPLAEVLCRRLRSASLSIDTGTERVEAESVRFGRVFVPSPTQGAGPPPDGKRFVITKSGGAVALSQPRDGGSRSIVVHFLLGATIFVTRPTLVSPAYRLSCLSIAQ